MSRVLWPLYCAATFSLCQVPLAVALDSAAPSEQQPVATTRHVLSLADAIKRALFAHPEIQASQSEWLAAQAALQQAGALPNPELSLLMEDLRAGSQLAQALERYHTTREEAENLRQAVLPAASNAHDLALRGYELGKYSLLDVQDAQRSLLQVRNQYLRARLEALRSANEIERIVGGPNSAWLAGKSLPFPE